MNYKAGDVVKSVDRFLDAHRRKMLDAHRCSFLFISSGPIRKLQKDNSR